jgi:cystathionine gamma-synthase
MMDDESSSSYRKLSPETLSAQALGRIDPVTRGLTPAIHPGTTFQRDLDGGYSSGRGYTRPHNPTYDEPEELLAILEGGSDCLLFASGMAAATAIFQSLLPGDHVVAPRVMYWALRKWLVDFAVSWGLEVEFVDTSSLDALKAAIRPGSTQLTWLETPANPTWEITDIAAAVDITHAVGARVVVDSTVASPVLTRPIELGADLVVHSASKYLNGHSDVLAGAVITSKEDAFWQRVRAWQRDGGAMLGPFEAWLLQRGLRTLFLRVSRSSQSAMAIAQHFVGHPRVSQVLYPGLPEHSGHSVAAKQMNGGFGGMLSLRIRGGEAAAMEAASGVSVIKRATSLGGTESLIEHRASIEGPASPVPADLLRLSIGLESVDDLITDLELALDAITTKSSDENLTHQFGASNPHQIEEIIDSHIRPMVLERGGDIDYRGTVSGVLKLRIVGSPGASLPLASAIRNTVRHYSRNIHDVQFEMGEEASRVKIESVEDRVQRVLDEVINPAVDAHGGQITMLGVDDGTLSVRLSGGCQGCAMAASTLRQGVEPIVKKLVPEIMAIVDITDHPSGLSPYYKTKKS